MGLFKKSADAEEMERLKAEVRSMGVRLSASEHDSQSADQVERLEAEVQSMEARLSASGRAEQELRRAERELRQTVNGLVARLEKPMSPPPDGPPPSSPADDLTAAIDELRHRVDELGTSTADAADAAPVDPAEVDALQASMQRITDRIDELDGRITAISTELANQITEMSGELDQLGTDRPATDDVVDELRDAQSRLAGEQARYQIAFRQDLADLADRIKRA